MFISFRISFRVKLPEPRINGDGRPISCRGLVLDAIGNDEDVEDIFLRTLCLSNEGTNENVKEFFVRERRKMVDVMDFLNMILSHSNNMCSVELLDEASCVVMKRERYEAG
jgi:hypothetical protein